MANFRLLRRARADLLDIGAFTTRRWGYDQSKRHLTKIFVAWQTWSS